MIRCGLAKDIDGVWKVEQLSVELKNIIQKYRNHFDGEKVVVAGAILVDSD